MLIADRLRERMSKFRLSQSELARRVGVTQTTIRKLVSGGGYGSKYLHLIARELHTTPAYLTGETDDPDEGAPPPPPAPPYQAITLQVLLPGEAALAQMFEGLLMAMDRDLPLDEQARLLAQRLPTGLSQLRDLMPALPKAAAAKPRPSRPTPARAPR
ncbi:helix-turn-helix domain-containing protein [Sphingomonas olei]|uniref:Helix-turn-helix transcriptional regulator n=1 Tax=Sphingomonas olei TaxID=1886787 RepID=A0ABY2QIB2_9SPHN|nr:helix-turn-helix transcriptional regulator [Sphingomonas olei]